MPDKDHYKTAKHRAWAQKVLRRDKYLCQQCKRYGKKVQARVAHHKVPLETDPSLAFALSNGEALCFACHNKLHPEKGGPPSSKKFFGGVLDRGAAAFPSKR